MGLIVFDMGRRIETPVTPPRLRTRKATPASASSKVTAEHSEALLADSYGSFSGTSQQEHAPQSVAFARDIMSTPVRSLPLNETPEKAYETMLSHGIHHLPLVTDEGDLSAIISDRDLLKALAGLRTPARQVINLASRPVFCVQESTDIRQTARLLCDYHIGALPVLNEHQALTGIITKADLLQLISHYGPLELWA